MAPNANSRFSSRAGADLVTSTALVGVISARTFDATQNTAIESTAKKSGLLLIGSGFGLVVIYAFGRCQKVGYVNFKHQHNAIGFAVNYSSRACAINYKDPLDGVVFGEINLTEGPNDLVTI